MGRTPNDGLGYQNWPYTRQAGQDQKYFPHKPSMAELEAKPNWRKDPEKFATSLINEFGPATANEYLSRER